VSLACPSPTGLTVSRGGAGYEQAGTARSAATEVESTALLVHCKERLRSTNFAKATDLIRLPSQGGRGDEHAGECHGLILSDRGVATYDIGAWCLSITARPAQ
jgi:hypothetical protein